MTREIVVTELVETCPSSPAQWEGRTSDGKVLYIRYRYGFLYVGIGDTLPDAVLARRHFHRGAILYGEQIGDGYDGCITLAEVEQRTGLVLSPTTTHPRDAEGRASPGNRRNK
jgi:hypothetical protein